MSQLSQSLQQSLRDAATKPDSWDVPGLMADAANRIDELERLFGKAMKLIDSIIESAFQIDEGEGK